MITYSIIKKSQLEGAHRLDAEYYQPEYLELIDNLDKLGAVPIREVATNPKRKFKPRKGEIFQYIEISEVDLSTGEYNKSKILGENTPDRAQWIVKQNDVIISTVRPIRNAVSLINENTKNLVCSSGFAVLETQKIEPEYLFIYLKTRPVVNLLDRQTTATMYPAVAIEHILNIKVYLGNENFRQEIKNEIIETQKELEKSKSLYSQAEELLLKELGLKDFKVEEDLSYSVNLSDIKSAHRADAEYFQPLYHNIQQKLFTKPISFVKEEFNLIKSKNFEYKELGEISVIKTKQVNKNAINFKVESKTSIEIATRLNLPILIDKDVIFASMGVGSLGKTNIFYKFEALDKEFTIDSTLKIFRQKTRNKILPEVLAIFLNLEPMQKLIYKFIVGTSGIISIYENDLRNLPVPILPDSIQQQIASLVQQSHEARKKAKELLEEAKQKVEKMIKNSK
jgi:restriction endonuclease S subunit